MVVSYADINLSCNLHMQVHVTPWHHEECLWKDVD